MYLPIYIYICIYILHLGARSQAPSIGSWGPLRGGLSRSAHPQPPGVRAFFRCLSLLCVAPPLSESLRRLLSSLADMDKNDSWATLGRLSRYDMDMPRLVLLRSSMPSFPTTSFSTKHIVSTSPRTSCLFLVVKIPKLNGPPRNSAPWMLPVGQILAEIGCMPFLAHI